MHTYIPEVKIVNRVMLSKDRLVSQELELQINQIDKSHFANFNIQPADGERQGLGPEASLALKLSVTLGPVGT